MSNFLKRTLTGLVAVIILVFVLYQGDLALKLALLILSLGMLWELRRSLVNKEIFLSYPLLVVFDLILFFTIGLYHELAVGFLIILFILIITFVLDDEMTFWDLGLYAILVLYIPFTIFQLIYLDHSLWIYWIWILSFGTDTFAYLIGMTLGKHKLIPKLSPNKSVEGALGGVFGAVLLSFLYFHFMEMDYNLSILGLSILASIVSQFGDLFASKIKREMDIKDYGKILPGHGGLMDRFDSTIPVIALISIYVQCFIK